MNELPEPFDIGNMFPEEIDALERELNRIAEKYTCALARCVWRLKKSGKENEDGSYRVILEANKFMIEAYIKEQIL